MSQFPEDVEKWLKENIYKFPNVIGYSKKICKRIKGGKIVDEDVIRIYVKKKVPITQLNFNDIIPKEIFMIPTDVVEIGEIQSPPPFGTYSENKKLTKLRPVPIGVSIGNANITSGTLAWPFKYKGEIFYASNAHVVADSEFNKPEKVLERRILQPGRYIAGLDPNNVVGEYFWHEKIYYIGEISDCEVSKDLAKFINIFPRIFKRKTRLVPIVSVTNYIDFGVYRPTVPHIDEYIDKGFPETRKLVGLIFAGSNTAGVICKIKYIIERGYEPLNALPTDVKVGDKLWFSSMWCSGELTVIDTSAEININYRGLNNAFFDDVIITNNPGGDTVKGGCSGSAVWLKELIY